MFVTKHMTCAEAYLPHVAHTGNCVAAHTACRYQLPGTLTAAHWALVFIHTPAQGVTVRNADNLSMRVVMLMMAVITGFTADACFNVSGSGPSQGQQHSHTPYAF